MASHFGTRPSLKTPPLRVQSCEEIIADEEIAIEFPSTWTLHVIDDADKRTSLENDQITRRQRFLVAVQFCIGTGMKEIIDNIYFPSLKACRNWRGSFILRLV